MEPRISLITLRVADLKHSASFYRDSLGFRTREESIDGIAFFDMDCTWLSLFPRSELAADVGVSPKGAGFSASTFAHNVREREEVDALLAQASRAGALIGK